MDQWDTNTNKSRLFEYRVIDDIAFD